MSTNLQDEHDVTRELNNLTNDISDFVKSLERKVSDLEDALDKETDRADDLQAELEKAQDRIAELEKGED